MLRNVIKDDKQSTPPRQRPKELDQLLVLMWYFLSRPPEGKNKLVRCLSYQIRAFCGIILVLSSSKCRVPLRYADEHLPIRETVSYLMGKAESKSRLTNPA